MIDILWLIPTLFFHESGHWLVFKWFGYKVVNIRFTWYGVVLGENVFLKSTPFQALVNYIGGILGGLFFLIVVNHFIILDNNILLAYLFMCMFDIVGIINMFDIPKNFRNQSLLEFYNFQIKKLNEEYKELMNDE